jgi:hypothetical protein
MHATPLTSTTEALRAIMRSFEIDPVVVRREVKSSRVRSEPRRARRTANPHSAIRTPHS